MPWSRGAGRPPVEWQLAAAFVVVGGILALAGARSVALSGATLFAPGFALVGVLPARVRAVRLATLAAAPILGFAASTIALITVSRIGIPLGVVSVRCVVAAVILLAAFTWPRDAPAPARASKADVAEGAALLGIVALGVVLGWRVIGRVPVPGGDWAHYMLYADEIRRHGSLLIDNPYWLLGSPFREDPAIPAAYGATLIMSGARAATLSRFILVFSILELLSVYAYARAWWGRLGGLSCAALVAVVPATQDILGWHGVPNLAALGLLALLFAYLAQLVTGPLDRRTTVGMAIVGVGLAAAHRSSFTIGVAAGALVVLAALRSRGRGILRDVGRTAIVAIVLGAGVAADIYARQKTFGGALPYTDYLTTKVDLSLAVRDLTWVLVAGAGAALVALLAVGRLDRAWWPALALAVVCCALGYAWELHVPYYYERVVFYLPIAAAPIVAAALVRLPRAGLVGGVAVAVAVVALIPGSWRQAHANRAFYTFADPVSMRGLDALSKQLRPGEVVVTDRCWGFLGTWLLSTPTLAALEPEDIQPKAELAGVNQARSILRETPAGMALARRLRVRYLVVDPACPVGGGGTTPPPPHGRAVFASPNLAIIRLPRTT